MVEESSTALGLAFVGADKPPRHPPISTLTTTSYNLPCMHHMETYTGRAYLGKLAMLQLDTIALEELKRNILTVLIEIAIAPVSKCGLNFLKI